jgi:hypothetical protein
VQAGLLALALVVLIPALASARSVELLLDPWTTPALVERLATGRVPLGRWARVHIVVFQNGQCLWRQPPAEFGPSAVFADEDILTPLVEQIRRAGLPWFAAADLLCWHNARQDRPAILSNHEEWLEAAAPNGCSTCGEPEVYASPFNPAVVDAISRLAGDLGGSPLAPDGMTVRCYLSSSSALGFSTAARLAFIREHRRDPLDIDFTDSVEVDEWRRWRESGVTQVLDAAVSSFRQARPGAPVLGWVMGEYYAQVADQRSWAAQDWLDWSRRSLVDGLIVEGRWAANVPPWQQVRTWCAAAGNDAMPEAGIDTIAGRPSAPLLYSRHGRGQQVLPQLASSVLAAPTVVLTPSASDDWLAVLSDAARLSGASPPVERGDRPSPG